MNTLSVSQHVGVEVVRANKTAEELPALPQECQLEQQPPIIVMASQLSLLQKEEHECCNPN